MPPIYLPDDIIYNDQLWSLSLSEVPPTGWCVEYVREGDMFPVSFTTTSYDEAQLMMLAWLQESGII